LQPEIQRTVKTIGEYKVRLGGQDETVEFTLGDSFFVASENSEWGGGEINVSVALIKTSGLITLEFHLSGTLNVICDRCLEFYPEKIESRQTLFVKYGVDTGEISENVIMLSREEHHLDISPIVNEFLLLALPLRKVHADNDDGSSGCNEKMIEKLEEHLIQEVEDVIDPRWDELKKLLDKN